MTALRTRRSRTLLLWLARATVVIYLAQIVAVDHWRPDLSGRVSGVEGSAAHVLHCHADADGCAEGGGAGLVGTLAAASLTPLPPAPVRAVAPSADVSFEEPFLVVPDRPPRAA